MCLKRKIQVAAFERQALLESFDGDDDFVAELMTEFVTSALEYPNAFKSSADDYPKISTLAHTLKGTAANVMCNPLSKVSGELELYTKYTNGISKQKVARQIRLVLFEIDRAVSEVKSIYG